MLLTQCQASVRSNINYKRLCIVWFYAALAQLKPLRTSLHHPVVYCIGRICNEQRTKSRDGEIHGCVLFMIQFMQYHGGYTWTSLHTFSSLGSQQKQPEDFGSIILHVTSGSVQQEVKPMGRKKALHCVEIVRNLTKC